MKNTTVAVLVECAFRAGFGALLAVPVVTAVASTGIARFPEGDRLLFEPGGLMLVEVMRALWSALMPLARGEIVIGLALVVALILPHSLMLVACAGGAEDTKRELWGRACARVPVLLSLKGLTLLAQASIVFLTALSASGLRSPFVGATSRRADLIALGVSLLGVLIVLAFGVVRDLASAASVRGELAGRAAVTAGLTALLDAPRGVVRGAALPAAGALGLVLVAAWLTGALDVSRPGAWRVLSVLLVHQLAVLGLVLCRLSWLGQASSLVALQVDTASSARR